MSSLCLCLCPVEIPCAALLGPGAEAVLTAEGPQRGFHRWDRLLQSVPHGCQLPAGQIHDRGFIKSLS